MEIYGFSWDFIVSVLILFTTVLFVINLLVKFVYMQNLKFQIHLLQKQLDFLIANETDLVSYLFEAKSIIKQMRELTNKLY